MKLSGIIPSDEQLKLIQGVEGELLRRKRTGRISGIIALAVAVLQVMLVAIEKDYITNIGNFFNNLIHFRFDGLIGPDGIPIPQLTGMLVLAASVGTYFLFRWTNFMLKESEEPFRYTFWIKPFEPVKDTPGKRFVLNKDDQFNLLHHDLMERLNDRIRRLKLLDVDSLKLPPGSEESLTSHIYISGHYAVREDKDGRWVIHVMPRIRIGPPSRPEALAEPVRYPLNAQPGEKSKEIFEDTLNAVRYNQMVERVYSRVATEIYRQIFSDVKGKINMFPTDYLRAVALFHEAKDFERSNTVDAYGYAIGFYRESRRHFDTRLFGNVSRLLLRLPLLWRFAANSQIMEARARIGYSRCLIYRRGISALSGRSQNTLFEIPDELEKKAIPALIRLHNQINKKWKIKYYQDESKEKQNQYNTLMAFLTFPKDSLLKRNRNLFDKQRKTLFDACAVAALAYSDLNAAEKARKFLDNAKAVDPASSQEHALWLLAAAEIEPDINQKLLLFRKATEVAPNFEYAQYRLAQYSEMRLRLRNEINKERAENVIKEYDEVLRINPGNIGSLAAQGYLLWLLGDLEKAKKKFEEGNEIKAIVNRTFVGDLYYGLARIEAESEEESDPGQFIRQLNRSYDLYLQAISAEPAVCAYSPTTSRLVVSSYYDYMALDMLIRFKTFRDKVERKIEALRNKAKNREYENEEVSEKTLNLIHSFVLNDYGNANLNYFLRFGDREKLIDAMNAYRSAIKKDSENAVAYYNRHIAYLWRREPGDEDKVPKCLEKAEELARAWPVVRIASIKTQVRQIQFLINDNNRKKEEAEEELKKNNEELKAAQDKLKEINEKSLLQEKGTADELSRIEKLGKEKKELNEMIKKLDREKGELNNKTVELKEEIVKLQESLREKIFPKIDEILDQSKFISLSEGLKIKYDGTGVSEFCKKNIEKDKLEENDIDALRAWAELLSNNTEKKALEASEQLCRYILDYYPEDFDTYVILNDISRSLEIRSEKPDFVKKEDCIKRIRTIIENWLNIDPIYYVSLIWASQSADFFDFEKRAEILKRAIKSESENDVYHNMLGKVYSDKADSCAEDQWEHAVIEWEKAAEEYKKANQIKPENNEYRSNLSSVLQKEGDSFFDHDNYQKAIEKYKEVLELKPGDDISTKLDEARYALSFGKKALDQAFHPTVTPIPVEVANNLVPYVADETRTKLNPILSTQVEKIRERIKITMGVEIPGIKFRQQESLPDGHYIIMINEIPLELRIISEEKRLFPGSMESLTELKIQGEETTDPQTGEKAFWISRNDWEKVENAGLSLWGISEYMVIHLEAVIRKNVIELFGHQEIMNIMYAKVPDIYERMQEKPADLSFLTSVLKSLLNEGVPITALEEIVETFMQLKESGADLFTIVETIRSIPEVRPVLPGNNDKYSFYRLGELEKEINRFIHRTDNQPVLAIEIDKYQNIFKSVQEKIGSTGKAAIITENAELRPFVRKLIEHKFPDVPVLSGKELLPDLEIRIAGEPGNPEGKYDKK